MNLDISSEKSRRQSHVPVKFILVCVSLTADGPQRARLPIPPTVTLPSYYCLWSLSLTIVPISPWFSPTIFYHNASSALLHLVNQIKSKVKVAFHLLTFSRFPLRKTEKKRLELLI